MIGPRHPAPLPLGGDGLPYSKGVLARALMATGVPAVRAYELALRVEADLALRGEAAVELERLGELAREVLGEGDGSRAVGRLRRLEELRELDQPLILLIGGATGTGKSTLATEVAYRLGIRRVTSTDFVRQTMRAFFSREFMPAIHESSFEAGAPLAAGVVEGFLEQTRNVLVGVQAAIDRAIQEGWSLVLEGVHLVPGMLRPVEGALAVECVLAIGDAEEHAAHFWVRDAASEGLRPVRKYLDALTDIRLVHDHIVERARLLGVPVVDNADLERGIEAVIELVLTGTERLERVG